MIALHELGIYRGSYREIFLFSKKHPAFPGVVADMLLSGVAPEKITMESVEYCMNSTPHYKARDAEERLRPTRMIHQWELGDDE